MLTLFPIDLEIGFVWEIGKLVSFFLYIFRDIRVTESFILRPAHAQYYKCVKYANANSFSNIL